MKLRYLPFTILVTLAVLGGDDEPPGRLIYQKGRSPSDGTITAIVGQPGTSVPGGVMPCLNCHGGDGRGRPEGGVIPSNITWSALTRPYGLRSASGRDREPYNERTLARAISEGIDSAGNRLEVTMPRFRMSAADMADLIAYIKLLGHELDPGLSASEITVGVLLPPNGNRLQENLRRALDAWSTDLNERGGIYGRRLRLRYETPEPEPERRLAAARNLMTADPVFALVAPYAAGIEGDLADLARETATPIIGPITRNPRAAYPLPREVFYLNSGPADLARALVNFALHRQGSESGLVILHAGDDPAMLDAVSAVEDLVAERDLATPSILAANLLPAGGAGLARHLQAGHFGVILYLGLGSQRADTAFLNEVSALAWRPAILVPADAAGPGLLAPPPELAPHLFFAFPGAQENLAGDGAERYARLSERYHLPRRPSSSWLEICAAAALFEHGLELTGQRLSRAGLVDSLERLYDWPTGFTPALTYTPNRRIGARGGYIVTLDPASGRMVPASGWVDSVPGPAASP